MAGGALEAPGYVEVTADGVHFHEATGLWGLDVPSSLARLTELRPGAESAVIGPAGERGVLFASIVNNRGRSIGRGGLGAVMGAKNLKAITVAGHGTHKPPVADPERLEAQKAHREVAIADTYTLVTRPTIDRLYESITGTPAPYPARPR